MATLLFSAIGTIAGGPLGGFIGALAGRQVDAMLFGGSSVQGGRLKELEATTSSYGAPVPRVHGRMRLAGSIIWATDLVENRETRTVGGTTVQTYTYTASFAVALASRPIKDIGRIWADGNLLRGASGDLKTAGTMRIHLGHGDQEPDPLIAEIEGADRCPAYRGLAYVVFEDLDLTDFYNRLPSLTFEVSGDDESAVSLDRVIGDLIEDSDAGVVLEGIAGLSLEGSVADLLRALDPVFPLDADASGERITLSRERLQSAPLALPEPAISVADGDFGGRSGFARKRAPIASNPPEILRYYDLDRDYLPGIQRAIGRAGPGQPRTIELPAAMTAQDARDLADRTARRSMWSRERIAWRTAELDRRTAPGAIVTLPDRTGRWRVFEWEWRDTGVELSLERIVPTGPDARPALGVEPGRPNPAADLAPAPTVIAAFELPWDGTGSGNEPALFAAVSSPGANWGGAALFADRGDGQLLSLSGSGRSFATMGHTLDGLARTNPLIVDRTGSVTVELIGDWMALHNATGRQLALGANRALIGQEIIQFARATALGARRWRLEGLLRGRGGTQSAVGSHAPGERFVLVDSALVALDPAIVGPYPAAEIVAAGRGDAEPVATPIALRGLTLRPLAPVHPRASAPGDGSLLLEWTRRARGPWQWVDGIEVPLVEQAETYQVTYGPLAAPVAFWTVAGNSLSLGAATLASLVAALPGGALHVRQQGTHAVSEPLLLATLP